jgi:hypothetical protein
MCHLTKPSGSHPCRGSDRGFKFQKSSQFLIGVHNETLSVVAMRVSNPDCSAVGINR